MKNFTLSYRHYTSQMVYDGTDKLEAKRVLDSEIQTVEVSMPSTFAQDAAKELRRVVDAEFVDVKPSVYGRRQSA